MTLQQKCRPGMFNSVKTTLWKENTSLLQTSQRIIRSLFKMKSNRSTGTTGLPTVHPFVCYFKEQGELHHLCFVIISESTQHDVIAVHLFQKKLIEFLKGEGKRPKKMIYISDGCAAQYINYRIF